MLFSVPEKINEILLSDGPGILATLFYQFYLYFHNFFCLSCNIFFLTNSTRASYCRIKKNIHKFIIYNYIDLNLKHTPLGYQMKAKEEKERTPS